MIEVAIVVAGAMGDLALSTLPALTAERQLFTRVVVGTQAEAGMVLERLDAAGLEVLTVTERAPLGPAAEWVNP